MLSKSVVLLRIFTRSRNDEGSSDVQHEIMTYIIILPSLLRDGNGTALLGGLSAGENGHHSVQSR